MTSNVGARKVQDFGTGIGFSSTSQIVKKQQRLMPSLKKNLKNKFSPEFLNRLDDINFI